MIKIRYHHLLCIPRFTGKGYSEEFCSNLLKIKNKLKSRNYILTTECDDVCKCCPNNINGRCISEEKVSAYDEAVKSALENGKKPLPENICSDCEWYYICKDL